MEKELFDKAAKLQEKIKLKKDRLRRLKHAVEYGGCGMKAVVEYTPGGCRNSTHAHIFDKEVIKQALICEKDVVEREVQLLEEEFDSL
jgi:hypothetical protein